MENTCDRRGAYESDDSDRGDYASDRGDHESEPAQVTGEIMSLSLLFMNTLYRIMMLHHSCSCEYQETQRNTAFGIESGTNQKQKECSIGAVFFCFASSSHCTIACPSIYYKEDEEKRDNVTTKKMRRKGTMFSVENT
jgi:hypothetical protein